MASRESREGEPARAGPSSSPAANASPAPKSAPAFCRWFPPAWDDVWICPDPKGHIQVTARDTRNRKQYRYHAEYRKARDRSKFRGILELSESLHRIRERAERDLRAKPLSRRQTLATVVQLLDKTLIRIGSDEYAKENRSYGLTTLKSRHVKVKGSELRFSFRGKSGVQHALSIVDRRIARIVQRCQDLPGQELFQYIDDAGKRQTIASEDVNEYLGEISASRHVTAKDFRTWAGTMLAGTKLREMGPAPTEREAKRNINSAVDAVAERLGNTRAVCRKYYIHPALTEAYLKGLTAATPRKTRPRRSKGKPVAALRLDEVAILQFLQDLI